jgi:hypothetical protein
VSVQRRPVHGVVACSARPCRVPTTMPEARLVTDWHRAGAEAVPVWAACWRVGDPLPGRRLYKLAQHGYRL